MPKRFTVFVQIKPRARKKKMHVWFYGFDGERVDIPAKDIEDAQRIAGFRLNPFQYDMLYLNPK